MKNILKSFNLMFIVLVAFTAQGALAANIMPMGCDNTGKNTFSAGEPVCVYGTGFSPDSVVDVYLIADKSDYKINDNLTDVTGSVEHVSINSYGVLETTQVWDSIVPGNYDLVADTNRNGVFDTEEPVNLGNGIGLRSLFDNDLDVPEFSTLGALALLVAAGFYIRRSRK